ncbi:SANT/Myb domain-containing protein [Cinnamomum micranthum f. kanehirae]|uniref:SANT/Myb domain-containing protein n=1 Tax=Cinnamomum micranthum f. kanehirae TaxID=337451 RepID=A0A3S3QN73_9MAGN|nr:SANT/Myb domain-containing protein [Cinnamomum micranthum f. kanehirae]
MSCICLTVMLLCFPPFQSLFSVSKCLKFLQIRSHAQKYFLKVQKNGTSEHVPPPRPKRKAAHPYPQKASKNAPLPSQAMAPFQSSSFLLEPGYTLRTDSSSLLRNSTANATVSSWTHNSVVPLSASHVTKDDIGPAGCTMANNCCCSSTESAPGTWPTCETADQVNHGPPVQAMPDFAQVYSFIGSVFDPNTTGHLQKLKEMDPIDVETFLSEQEVDEILHCAISKGIPSHFSVLETGEIDGSARASPRSCLGDGEWCPIACMA